MSIKEKTRIQIINEKEKRTNKNNFEWINTTIRFVKVSKKEKITKTRHYLGKQMNHKKESIKVSYKKVVEYRGLQIGSKLYLSADLKSYKKISNYDFIEVYFDIPEWADENILKMYKENII